MAISTVLKPRAAVEINSSDISSGSRGSRQGLIVFTPFGVMISEGAQSATPPLIGTAALASTGNNTGPGDGAV